MRTEAPSQTDPGWVLIQTDADAAPAVAHALTRLAGVTVERTAGAYDIVAHVDDRCLVGAERVVRAAAAMPGVQLAVCCHAPVQATVNAPVQATVPAPAHAPASRSAAMPAAGKALPEKSRRASRPTRRHVVLG